MSDSYQSKTGRYSVKRVLCDDAKLKLAKAREIAKNKRDEEKAKLIELEKLKQPKEAPPPDAPEPPLESTEPENLSNTKGVAHETQKNIEEPSDTTPKSSLPEEPALPVKPKPKKIEPGDSSDEEVAKPKKVKKKKKKSKIIISNDTSSSDSDDSGAVIYIKSRNKSKSKKKSYDEDEDYAPEVPIPAIHEHPRMVRTPREIEPPPIRRQIETISRPAWMSW